MPDKVDQLIEKIRYEDDSEAHKILRSYLGNKYSGEDDTVTPGIQAPGATGVIYCTDRAIANGFTNNQDPVWANLGQGAPEVGPLPDGPERPTGIDFTEFGPDINEYAPTTGVKELRDVVANLYNAQYRQDKESKYTYENVCIVPGGRAGMSRVAAVIGDVYTGYQVPEYTSYSEMLGVFKRLIPVPSALKVENNYQIDIEQLRDEIKLLSIHVVVLSNPRNPTGQVIEGDKLRQLVRIGDGDTTIVLDEFYSWYQYGGEEGKSVSGARYVNDVNKDSVVIIDGLTKGFRLPGWRVCWVVGPKPLISAIAQSGSFLDGGANHPLQLAAIPLLDPERVRQDRVSLQRAFQKKRDHVLARLAEMGFQVKVPPQATFYVWLDLSSLGAPLHDGLTFFEELLKEKCIVVPGIFFDVNPSHRRNLLDSPCRHFVRLSFGPNMQVLDRGLDAIERLVKKHGEGKVLGTGYCASENHDQHPGTKGHTI